MNKAQKIVLWAVAVILSVAYVLEATEYFWEV
jgi:hypothetical protein